MTQGIIRSIVRSIHLILAIPIVGYIYSPFDQIPNYAPLVRFVLFSAARRVGTLDVEGPCRSTAGMERSTQQDRE